MFFHPYLPGVSRRAFKEKREGLVALFFPAVLLLLPAISLCSAQQTAFDLNGKIVDPLKSNAGKVVVLVFIRRECAVSGRYAPVIQQMSTNHQKDVRFYLVFPDKSESSKGIESYLHDFRYSIPALHDSNHALVKFAHARVTPEAAVFNPKGALVYHGRIDNLYEAFGRARSAPTTHELEDAIQAGLDGRLPASKEVAGVGCYIADLP